MDVGLDMSITYTWKVKSVKVRDGNGVASAVVQTYWDKIGTDSSGHTGTFAGATPFPLESVNPESFIAFEDLTEEIVLGWIQSIVIGDYEKHVNEQIQKQIDDVKSPIVEPDLPWASANNG